MTKKITLLVTALALAFFLAGCSSKPVSKQVATEIFDNIVTIGKKQGKGCASSFVNRSIMKKAIKKAGASESGFAEYVKSDKGKKHMQNAIKNCMLKK